VFDKILIANRGEIACRIIATCRRLGVATVAIYSEADADAPHVRRADEAYCVGPAAARDSYLAVERVIAAARRSGAQAIHPGYGFLSENPDFAQRTADAGLVFIGPPVAAMRAMSSKATARELMQRAGVPVLPGYQGEQQEPSRLRIEAERVGYPVLIKAVAGGGGKGMRLVTAAAEFDAALLACQREASASFGDGRVLLEKYLREPRHIEMQVFGDAFGNVVHLYERDCSAQRRHQKVIEESPAPLLRAAQSTALAQAACAAARTVGYSSAGTVEFLFDRAGEFYFIEMNTRIQVEHDVTEMITGIDLIEWQLRIAAGERLPLAQEQITRRGHAIEARLYAEVPEAGFLPSSGTLRRFELPRASLELRCETGIESGDRVGIDYDPMLAKLIAHADTREQALAVLQAALSAVRIVGVGNNLLFLRRLLASAAFRAGGIDTGYIERELAELLRPAAANAAVEASILAAATLWTLEQERSTAAGAARVEEPARTSGSLQSPWQRADGWRLNGSALRRLRFEWLRDAGAPPELTSSPATAGVALAGHSRAAEVAVEYSATGPMLMIGTSHGHAALHALGADEFELRFGSDVVRLQILDEGGRELAFSIDLARYRLRRHDPLAEIATEQQAAGGLAAPMPGRIVAQLARPGDVVDKGTPLLVIEAMKMEHTLCAPAKGSVRAYRAAVGEQIQEGAQLVDFEVQA
jgi:3-methylcrotonyl-CoA carboxylase alpha subunit